MRFKCPQCGQICQAPAEYAGGSATCSNCRVRIRIPVPTIATDNAVDDTSSPTHTTSGDATCQMICPGCDKHIVIDVEYVGHKIICTLCGKRFKATHKRSVRYHQKLEQQKREAEESLRHEQRAEQLRRKYVAAQGHAQMVSGREDIIFTASGLPLTSHTTRIAASTPDIVGWIIVAIPACAALISLTSFLIIGANIGGGHLTAQGASGVTTIVTWGAVFITSILMGIDASMLGFHRIEINGKRGTHPVAWSLLGLLFWIIAFPWYLRSRRRAGVTSKCFAGLCTGILMILSSFSPLANTLDFNHPPKPLSVPSAYDPFEAMNAVIPSESDIAISNLADRLEDLGAGYYGTIVTFTVTNKSSQHCKEAMFKVIFYDSNDRIVATSPATLNDIPPYSSKVAETVPVKSTNVSKYEVQKEAIFW